MDIFSFIAAIAFCCYSVILLSMLHVRKTELRWIFGGALAVYVAWTLGALGVRLGFWPSQFFWHHVSMFGVIMIPVSTLLFMEAYMYRKFSKPGIVLEIVSVIVFCINVATNGWMIPSPTLVHSERGVRFFYDNFRIQTYCLYFIYILVTFYFVYVLWRGVKNGVLRKREFLIVSTGKLLVLSGNILIVFEPFMGFPVDMAMGILDSFCIMLMVVMSKKIRENREIYHKSMTVYSYMISVFLTLLISVPYEHYLTTYFSELAGKYLYLMLVFGMILFFIFTYNVISRLIGAFFFKEGEIQLIRINEFRAKSSQTLDVHKLHELIRKTAKDWMEAKWTELLVWEEATDVYAMTHPLPDGGQLRIPANNAFMQYIKNEHSEIELDALDLNDLSPECVERVEAMKQAGISLLQPFYDAQGMYAVLVISRGKGKYRTQEKHSLELLAEISMDAIRNAKLYTKVFWEARTDALTGVGNRKYLYEVMEKIQKENKEEPVSLALFKVDDFRVMNQIYGAAGGDIGLMKVAGLLREKLGEKTYVFRYGATEFIAVMPQKDTETARKLAEEIRMLVMQIDDIQGKKIMLTISVGICTVNKGILVDDKCLDKCAMAVYIAQQEGQNRTVVYGEQDGQEITSVNRRMYREYEPIFRALTSAVDAKDHYTAAHAQNVSYYATELAKAMNLEQESVEITRDAGLLHDIGKIGIPESILMKPDRLNEEEFRIMKTHVEQAMTILHHLSGMEYILPAVMGHHERYDGKGYPRGIAGEEIPITARIINIVDSFDAMVSTRPYKPQLPVEYAVQQLLKGKGTQFDPVLAEMFVKLIEEDRIEIRRVETVINKPKGNTD